MIEYKYSGTGKYDDEEVESYGKTDWTYGLIAAIFVMLLIIAPILRFLTILIIPTSIDWPFAVKIFFFLFPLAIYGALTHNSRDDYKAKIILYERYFMVNSNYIHYLGINKIEKDDKKGRLVVKYFIGDKKEGVVIKREKFPTNARKDFKIEANRRAKFEKVSEKIISYAKAANPDIEVIVKEVKKEVEHESI